MKGLKREHSSASCFKQQGAALIVIMFIVGLAAVALLIKSYNADSLRVQQEEKTMQALGQAKEALLAWSVSYRDLPGLMPYPNRGTDAAGYEDGGSDCFASATSFNYQFLLGMLPSRDSSDTNCITLSRKGLPDLKDAAGNPLWYAVSRNLVKNYEAPPANPVINPGMANFDAVKPKPYDGTEASSPYPWLIVRDMYGNVVSDRVAAVILAPGPPLAGQNRTNTATSAHFLDQIMIGAMTYSNRDYDQPDEDFVMGGDATLSNTFNDRLVFITIDELIHAVEKRAANEVAVALNAFRADNGGEFPYAASLGAPGDYLCKPGNAAGLLPLPKAPLVHTPNATLRTCDFEFAGTRSISCSNGFADLESVAYERPFGGFISANAGCSISGNSCVCSGAGNCTAGGWEFECDANADCTANVGGIAHVTPRCGHEFTVADGNVCSINADGSLLSCSPTASWIGSGQRQACGEAAFLPYLPAWITTNLWQDYFYYRNARGEVDTLTSGVRVDIEALLVGASAPLLAPAVAESKGADQIRPSCEMSDYLDSNGNANTNEDLIIDPENLIFDPHYLRRNTNYNDRVYIVAP